jgi:hypothetical protein
MAQIVKLRRSSVSGQKPTNSNLQLGELALNTTDGKVYMAVSGSLGPSVEELISTNTVNTGSIFITGNVTASNFSGSFKGDGSQLYNIPSSGVTGLELNKIVDGSATASISQTDGLRINTKTEITGSVIIDGLLSVNRIAPLSGSNVRIESSNLVVPNGGIFTSFNILSSGSVSASAFSGSALGLINVPFQISGSDVEGNTYNKQFTKLQFDDSTGLNVSESVPGTAFVSIGSHFKDIFVSGSPILSATGSDAFEIIPTGGVEITTSITDTNGNGYVKELNISTTTLSSSLNNRMDTITGSITTLSSSVNSLNTFTSSVVLTSQTSSMNVLSASYALTAAFALNAGAGGGTTSVTDGAYAVLNQTTPATTWSFKHNLGQRYPIFQVFDSNGSVILPSQITTIDINNATITFPSNQTGKVIASLGTGPGGLSQYFSSSDIWSLEHNLNSDYPIVTIWDTNRSIIFPQKIESIDTNNIRIYFSTPVAGYVNVAKGGHIISGSVSAGSIDYVGSNIVSGSSQILITGTTGYSTFSGSISSSIGSLSSSVATTTLVLSSSILSLSSSVVTTTNNLSSSISSSIGSLSSSIATTDSNQNTRLDNIENSTGSLNSFTSSINTTIKSKLDSDGVISGSIQVLLTGTTGYSTFSSSISTSIGSLSSSIATTTSGLTSTITSLSSSLSSSIDSLSSSVATTTNNLSSSISSSIGSLSSSVASINNTQNGRLDSLETESGSIRTNFNTFTSSYNTGSFTGSFTGDGSQLYNIPSSGITGLNLSRIASGSATASISPNNGLRINTNTEITGSVVITQNLTVLGSSSISYVTSSQLNVATSFISVNVFEPAERFGGLKVYDSGSASGTASLAWDSLHNHWVYQNVSGSNYSGGMLLAGPRNTGSLGDEPNLINGRIVKSVGGDHIDVSIISETGTTITVAGDLVANSITGAFDYFGLVNRPTLISGSSQIDITGTTGYSTFSSSVSSSMGLLSSSVATTTSGLSSSINSLSSSVATTTLNLKNRVDSIEGITGSISSLNSFTGSINTTIKSKLDSENVISGSVQVELTGTTGFSTFSSSVSTSIGSLSSSIATTTLGTKNRVDSIESKTGSYATTGSNVFIGNQTISGSVYITGSEFISGTFNLSDSATNFSIQGNIFSQTYLNSNGAIVLNPGYGGVEMVGSYRELRLTNIYAAGFITGSFTGSGAGLYDIPASGITGLNLSQIATGSATASISSTDGLRINTKTEISGSLNVSGSGNITGDLTVQGNLIAQQFIVSSSVTYLTTSFSSGSTKFGDSLDDTHQFTGSVLISGSIVSTTTPLVSGSSQISYSGLTGIPSGIVSGSSQVLNGSGVWSGSAQLPSGVVSGSSQIIYSGLTGIPSDIVSGSSQLTGSYDTRYVLSGSITQTTWDNIASKPPGIISGSVQIINLGFATTSSNDFYGNRFLYTNSSATGSWVISHYLGYQYPNVDIYDSSNQILIPQTITAVSENTMQIDFATPTAGKAILTTGGARSTGLFVETGSYYNATTNIGITGSLVVTGDVDAANFNTTSDRKLKTNLVRIENALDKIEKLNGYTFDWLEEYSEDRTRQIGMVADEVYEVQPELISHRNIVLSNKEEKIKLLDYSKVTAILIEAIKELNDKVTKLENKKKKK